MNIAHLFMFLKLQPFSLESHFQNHLSLVKMSSTNFLCNLGRWQASRIAGLLD